MTTLIAGPPQSQNVWSSMPGWGIVADLTPPELVAARRLAMLRKIIVIGLVLVIALCAAAYAYVFVDHSSAADAAEGATTHTTQLTTEQAKYQNVTRIRQQTQAVNDQISTLMATDVDAAKLLVTLRNAMPGTMALSAITATMGATTGTSTAATLNVTGRPVVGSITLTGSAPSFPDVAAYASALSKLPGVVNVTPTNNTANSAGGTQWQITLQITDKLYSHRYTTSAGGK